MNLVNFQKLSVLPAVLEPGAVYFVINPVNPAYTDIFVVDSTGLNYKKVYGLQEVDSAIYNAIANLAPTNAKVVANIDERDLLAPVTPVFAVVVDATGDPSVQSGSASYVYDPTSSAWIKISEYESLDVTFSWDQLQNKPASLVEDIDDAVTKKHDHTNKSVLDRIGEDATGKFTFDNLPIVGSTPFVWTTEEW